MVRRLFQRKYQPVGSFDGLAVIPRHSTSRRTKHQRIRSNGGFHWLQSEIVPLYYRNKELHRRETTTMQPLFICGCGHSGTSLLANMFAANPFVFVPLRETRTFVNTALIEPRWLALKDEWLSSGRPHLVEKTPKHVRHIDPIRQTVPGARFAFMVRDGRDVAASHIKRIGEARSGAMRWVEENSIVEAEAASPDTIVLKYEDLIEAPKDNLQKICKFASIPYSDDMLDYHKQERKWFNEKSILKGDGTEGAQHRALRNWQINQPIFDGRGAWQEILPMKDVEFFTYGEAARLMATFGYSSSTQRASA